MVGRLHGARLCTVATVVVVLAVTIGCRNRESKSETVTAASSDDGTATATMASTLAGTWALARVDRYDQFGDPLPDYVHPTVGRGDPHGYLMYDGERVGMVLRDADGAPVRAAVPTPAEALAAVQSYTAYFGSFSVHATDGFIAHRIVGSLNPRRTGGELHLFYELAADGTLVLTPGLLCPDSFVTDRGCGYGTTGVQLRYVWKRVGPSTTIEAVDPFLGVWEFDRIERRTADGHALPTPQFAEGYLFYMASGHMSVQLMRPDRAPYQGIEPTAAEAAAAMQGYVSYFGPFHVDADAGVVVHDRAGALTPNDVGVDARRRFEFRDGQLVLEPPPSTVDGQEIESRLYWSRVPRLGSAPTASSR